MSLTKSGKELFMIVMAALLQHKRLSVYVNKREVTNALVHGLWEDMDPGMPLLTLYCGEDSFVFRKAFFMIPYDVDEETSLIHLTVESDSCEMARITTSNSCFLSHTQPAKDYEIRELVTQAIRAERQ